MAAKGGYRSRMMSKSIEFFFVLVLAGFCIFPAASGRAQAISVATYECPPFVMRDGDGLYTGLSIHLWEEIAQNLNVEYDFVELPLDDLLAAAAEGSIDAGVSCVSITHEREETVDFSHSFYETHLAIAVREEGLLVTLKNIFSDSETLYWLVVVVLLASAVGAIYYLLEHRINPKLYSRQTKAGQAVESFLLGLLFITRGPINYYEFKTLAGRAMTVMLAVLSTLFIASFTAVLASAFTIDRLRSTITGPRDLAGISSGVKAASTAGEYLDELGIGFRTFETVTDMLDALERGTIKAAVMDDPVVRYEIKLGQSEGRYGRLSVLPYKFGLQNYGIVLPEGSDLVEEINRALLETRATDRWWADLARYIGAVK
jgi:polar amino acid transport system substrate-binding protein